MPNRLFTITVLLFKQGLKSTRVKHRTFPFIWAHASVEKLLFRQRKDTTLSSVLKCIINKTPVNLTFSLFLSLYSYLFASSPFFDSHWHQAATFYKYFVLCPNKSVLNWAWTGPFHLNRIAWNDLKTGANHCSSLSMQLQVEIVFFWVSLIRVRKSLRSLVNIAPYSYI